MLVLGGFQITSSAGPMFDLAVWCKDGRVLVPDIRVDKSDIESSSEQSFLPFSDTPSLGSQYGKAHFDLIRSWLGTCRHHQEPCNRTANDKSILPSRLIDITRMMEGTVTLNGTRGKRGSYCALSYCWGKRPERHIKTTTETISQHQTGIKTDHLPQVFKDAIRVTQEIGLHYLWVDSLCIIQDDSEDWEAEAERMADVYRNADLVIAAAGASDPSEGCFIRREMSPKLEVTICQDPSTTKSAKFLWIQEALSQIKPLDGPSQTRGWTLQETCLARRSLHFMPSGMFWKCQDLEAFERTNGLYVLPQLDWLLLLHCYSYRKLAKKEDRLFAIQGLVNELMVDRGSDIMYQKGVFNVQVSDQILWSMQNLDNLSINNADIWEDVPTWSWAHKAGRKRFWFMNSEIQNSLQEDKSEIELTLENDNVLRFVGYSATVKIESLDYTSRDLTVYEDAVEETARFGVGRLHRMYQVDGNTQRVIGFAAPDIGTVHQRDMTILFIAERTWAAVQKQRENIGYQLTRNFVCLVLQDPPSQKVHWLAFNPFKHPSG